MAERKRIRLVVSDFHLGKGRYFSDRTANFLEDFIYDREFAEFLDYHCVGEFQDADVELILNGDILNLLQMDTFGVHTHLVTERSVVRATRKIVAGHPEFFQGLRRFANTPNHRIVYIVGNHDAGMLWPGPRQVFNEAVGQEVEFRDVSYFFDGVHIEHGQQHESFSRIDMKRPFITRGLPEPVLNLPWGSLFVAILLPQIKQDRPHVDKVRPFPAFLRWAAIHDLWWGIKTVWKLARFVWDTMLIKGRYQIRQGMRTGLGILGELNIYPNFDKIAFKVLAEHPEINTVIFGHTHVLKHKQWKEGKEYVNEGTWNEVTNLYLDDYGRQIRLTYAYIDYPNAALGEGVAERPRVRLKQWHGFWRPESEILV